MLAVGNGLEDEGASGFVAADQFDDHLDLGVAQDGIGTVNQHPGIDADPAVGGNVEIRYSMQSQPGPKSLLDKLGVLLEHLDHPGANGSEPK